MAGHSKWSNIKHKKKLNDIQKSKLSTKIIKHIVTAAKVGGKDLKLNSKLRLALNKAVANNISKATVERAISENTRCKKTSSVIYAGYCLYNVVFLIECMVSNRNKVASELRYIFSENGGKLVSSNSVKHLFEKICKIFISSDVTETILAKFKMLNIEYNDKLRIINVKHTDLDYIKNLLTNLSYNIQRFVFMRPYNIITVNVEKKMYVIKIVDDLKKLNYVLNVYINVKL